MLMIAAAASTMTTWRLLAMLAVVALATCPVDVRRSNASARTPVEDNLPGLGSAWTSERARDVYLEAAWAPKGISTDAGPDAGLRRSTSRGRRGRGRRRRGIDGARRRPNSWRTPQL